METTAESAVGHDELAVLKLLALDGAVEGQIKTSCRQLADRLGASTQTASRRLRRLESADHVDRETVSDGQWVRVTATGERCLRGEYEDYRRIFDDETTVDLVGTVTDGMGEGRHYITLSGYMEQFREKLGYEPFPGTLNVTLEAASVRRRSGLSSLSSVRIEGWSDEDRTYGPADCYAATVAVDGADAADADEGTTEPGSDGDAEGTREYDGAHVIVPERTHHDEDQIELIAPDKLRSALDLDDDDRIEIRVTDR